MTMLDIAGGILIAGGIISLIAFGLAGYFNHEAGALAVWIILVGFATAGAVIFHSYIPAAATAVLDLWAQ